MRVVIDTGRLAGVLGLAGGSVVLGTVLVQAVLVGPVSRPLPASDTGQQGSQQVVEVLARDPSARRSPSDRVVSEAARSAPFDPARQAPMRRYQLPGQQVFESVAEPEPMPVPSIRVLGTITGAGGGIAVIQEEGGTPRVVSVGDMIGEFRLSSVREEAVTVSSRGFDIALSLQEAASGMQEDPASGNRGNRRGEQDVQQVLEALQERLGSAMRVMMGDDGRPYVIGPNGARREIQLPGRVAGRGGRGGGNTQIPPVEMPTPEEDPASSEGGY